MPGADLSPALELAVSLLANGQTIPAHLCDRKPKDVDDIARCAIGTGVIDGNGGVICVHKPGDVVCIAYDVRGLLVTSTTTGMPCRVNAGAQCKVGTLTFGKEGVPHGP
jgi:hypothetical protein